MGLTTPAKLWEALTRPELTRLYFYGTDFVSELKPGATFEYTAPQEDGGRKAVITGKILEVDPPRRLVHTFQFVHTDDEPTQVTYELEPMGDLVKLTLTHAGFAGETQTYQDVRQGWGPIFDGLKTYLETGTPLSFPKM